LQCVAVCCSVLQCVAVCCSVLQSLSLKHIAGSMQAGRKKEKEKVGGEQVTGSGREEKGRQQERKGDRERGAGRGRGRKNSCWAYTNKSCPKCKKKYELFILHIKRHLLRDGYRHMADMRNALQQAATTHCNKLQHTATSCQTSIHD